MVARAQLRMAEGLLFGVAYTLAKNIGFGNEGIGGLPQDPTKATLAPMLTRDDGRIDFARTAQECDQRRRGFTPWPGAWTHLRGEILKIHAAEPILQSANQPPGEIVKASADGIFVACAGSVWRLIELQLEGKRRLAAAPFLAGMRLQPGDRLGT